MANAYYGKNIVGELSDAQELPTGTGSPVSADSTNMVYIAGATGGQLWINVYANTAVAVGSTKLFDIELEGYTSDTSGSATPPFTTANSGGIPQASGTLEADAHYYLIHKTSGDGALDFSAGSLITQCAIPEDLFRLLSYDWVQLKYNSDEDLSAQDVDAFVWVKPS